MKLISQGAEAKIYLTGSEEHKDKRIIKDRIKKDYRIEEIDNQLRRFRTRREAKILSKLHKFNFVPKVLENDEKEKLTIEYIEGPKIRDVLDKEYVEDRESALDICREIARKVKLMHDNDIIHGDLTTSNMILNENAEEGNKVFFIDFGLSFVSTKTEDKAVDLHLLKQALESKHYKIWKDCFNAVLEEYNNKLILDRLMVVEKRGRNKGS
jgi:TP53 regulating kinase-like protein